jgi:hypothetical protein
MTERDFDATSHVAIAHRGPRDVADGRWSLAVEVVGATRARCPARLRSARRGAAYPEGSDVTPAACPGRSCIVARLRRDGANELAVLAGRLRRIAPPFSQAGATGRGGSRLEP